jgi:hypothetical protein
LKPLGSDFLDDFFSMPFPVAQPLIRVCSNTGDFILEVLIHHNQRFDPGVNTRVSATLLLDALVDKFGKVVDGEGNSIHLPLAFPPHILMGDPININNGRRGRIAQQHINIHP